MTKKLTLFSKALDEFYGIKRNLRALTDVNNALLNTKNFDVITVIRELIQKLEADKQRLLEIKAFTDNIDYVHPCYDMDMDEALYIVKNQLAWLSVVERIHDIGYVNGQDSKKDDKAENPMSLTQIIDYLKNDRYNIVDLFFEKIQTYKDEDRTFSLLVDLSNPADISARVETDISTGRVQGPFLKIFTLIIYESYAYYTKDELYKIATKELDTFEQTITNLANKKQITVTLDDKRRLVDLLDHEEAKYFLKEFADCETECTLDEGWLIDADNSSKALQSTYYQSLKTDQEREIYATAIGQQYALDFLCSSIVEVLRMYDLEHLNTFFKTVELVMV